MTVELVQKLKTEPFVFLCQIFEWYVLRPNGALPLVTEEGYASPQGIRLEAARDVFAAEGPDWDGFRPPIFDERVFINDIAWEPLPSARCKWTEEEGRFLNSIQAMVEEIFRNATFTIVGIKEPTGHVVEWARVDDQWWWVKKIKVDFAKGLLWAGDETSEQWRLMFSSLTICHTDYYKKYFGTLGGLFGTTGPVDETDRSLVRGYEKQALMAPTNIVVVGVYLEAFGHLCKNQPEFAKRCETEKRPVSREITRTYIYRYYPDLRPAHWPPSKSRS